MVHPTQPPPQPAVQATTTTTTQEGPLHPIEEQPSEQPSQKPSEQPSEQEPPQPSETPAQPEETITDELSSNFIFFPNQCLTSNCTLSLNTV